MRGVPLRMEIGPKDLEKSQVVLARRDTREKSFVPMDGLAAKVEEMLCAIQKALYDRAVQFRTEHTTETDSYAEFKQIMDGRPGFVIAPWCGSAQCEADIKAETQATIRNIPFTTKPRREKVPEVRRPCDDARLVCEVLLVGAMSLRPATACSHPPAADHVSSSTSSLFRFFPKIHASAMLNRYRKNSGTDIATSETPPPSGVTIAETITMIKQRVLRVPPHEACGDDAHSREEEHDRRHLEDEAERQDHLDVERKCRRDARHEGQIVVREADEEFPGERKDDVV
jgi:hypothetical protein